MRIYFLTAILLFCSVLLAGCGQTGAGNKTAAGMLPVTDKTVKERADDAYLTDIYSLTSSSGKTYSDGTSEKWYYTFYSPSRSEEFLVIVDANSGTAQEVKKSSGHTVAVPEGWKDTPEIAGIAGEKCAGTPEGNYFYSLFVKDAETVKWSVNCQPEGQKKQKITIDGLTGEILNVEQLGI